MRRALAVFTLSAGLAASASAQCVMCYLSAHAQNAARSRVLDTGILLLGAPPIFLLAGFIAFVFAKDKIGQSGE